MMGMGRTARLPLIDGLRAVAALLIFAYHALYVTGNLSRADYGWYLNVGVPLFYAISGLLLFRPFAKAILSAEALPSLSEYFRHRLFRIIPAYWLALPLIAILLVRGASVFTPSGIITYFGFLQIYRLSTFTGGIGQAWTLCVEMTFYLVLPFFALLVGRLARRAGGQAARLRALLCSVALLAACSLVWKMFVVHHFAGDLSGLLVPMTVLPAALDQFAVGMAIAVLLVAVDSSVGPSRLLRSSSRFPLLPLAFAAVAFVLIGWVYGIDPFGSPLIGASEGWKLVAEHELKAAFAGGLLLAAVVSAPGRSVVGRVLAFNPLRQLGQVSYGFYLWHLSILIILIGSAAALGSTSEWIGGSEGLLSGHIPSLVGVGVALLVTLIVATASWQLLEQRMIAFSHRRTSRR